MEINRALAGEIVRARETREMMGNSWQRDEEKLRKRKRGDRGMLYALKGKYERMKARK